MGVITFTDEFSSTVSAGRMFRAVAIEFDELMPKLHPEGIKNIEIIQGDGGPGSIKQMNIIEGGKEKHLKHRIDALDKEKMTYDYTLIEGDDLKDIFESISYELKFEPVDSSAGAGCKGTNISKYHPKPGVEIDEAQIKESKEKAAGVFKVIEAYLLANPNAFA